MTRKRRRLLVVLLCGVGVGSATALTLFAFGGSLVFFEAPSRLADSLFDIAGVLGNREAAVARELTKMHEEVRRASPAELARWAAEVTPKGEMVIVVGPPLAVVVTDAAIAQRLAPLMGAFSLSEAVRNVARELSVPRKRVYDLALGLQSQRE